LAWLLGSLALALIATNLAGLIFHLIQRGRSAAALAGRRWLQPIGWLLASLFFLLPPLGAWRFGALSPYLMGFTEVDWIESLRAGGLLVGLIIALLIFGWLVYRHSLPSGEGPSWMQRLGARLHAPLDAGLRQLHWAFYRALVISLLPAAAGALSTVPFAAPVVRQLEIRPLYWGTWLGLAWVALEWVLNPFARGALHHSGQREATLRGVVLAVATSAVFALTRNFWLCLACDMIIETAIAGWFPLRE